MVLIKLSAADGEIIKLLKVQMRRQLRLYAKPWNRQPLGISYLLDQFYLFAAIASLCFKASLVFDVPQHESLKYLAL